MWPNVWPDRDPESLPIGHVTRCPHRRGSRRRWTDLPPLAGRENWEQQMHDPSIWERSRAVDGGGTVGGHEMLRRRSSTTVRGRVRRQFAARGVPTRHVHGVPLLNEPRDGGWPGRFVSYKRPTSCSSTRPAGRAGQPSHRSRAVRLCRQGRTRGTTREAPDPEDSRSEPHPRFAGKIGFRRDYDIEVARHLVSGVDVWLNTPRRGLSKRAGPAA